MSGVQELGKRHGSGDGEGWTLLTRQVAFEPLLSWAISKTSSRSPARFHGELPPSGHCNVVTRQGSDRPEDERRGCRSRDRMRPWNAKVPAARRATGRNRSDTVWTDFKAPRKPLTPHQSGKENKRPQQAQTSPLPTPTAHEACIRLVRPWLS
jgi:hypothetical protein